MEISLGCWLESRSVLSLAIQSKAQRSEQLLGARSAYQWETNSKVEPKEHWKKDLMLAAIQRLD